MPKTKTTEAPKKSNAEKITDCLIAMRRNQSETDASFLASLGTLTSQQLNVLYIIGDNQPCPMTTIGYITALPFSNATIIVDQLVRKRLVKRKRNEKDRRVIYTELTSKGLEIYNSQINYIKATVGLVLTTLSPEEQNILAKFMERISNLMK